MASRWKKILLGEYRTKSWEKTTDEGVHQATTVSWNFGVLPLMEFMMIVAGIYMGIQFLVRK